MVTVRRYGSGDGPAVRRLHELAVREEGTDPDDIPGTDDLQHVRESYLDTGGEFLVAEAEGSIVGMGGLRIDGSSGELFRMRVHPDYQQQGIGTRLLDGLEAAARERGVESLRAETARRQSTAIEFYPARGYETHRTRSFGEYDLVEFKKDLRE